MTPLKCILPEGKSDCRGGCSGPDNSCYGEKKEVTARAAVARSPLQQQESVADGRSRWPRQPRRKNLTSLESSSAVQIRPDGRRCASGAEGPRHRTHNSSAKPKGSIYLLYK